MDNNLIYKCRVPLDDTIQQLIVDGKGDFKGVNLAPNESLEKMLQVIEVRDSVVEEPVEILNSYILDKNAKAKILLCTHTLNSNAYSTNEEINISLEEGALLDMIVMQNENANSIHTTSFKVSLKENSLFNLYLITLNGGEVTNNITVTFNDKMGECNMYGLYLAAGEQRVNTNINVCHNYRECRSSQLFKGVLDGNAVTTFGGRIYVAKDAQKTEAYQANNNLLSSKTAKAYTQPHLEIYADDVKCSHGATIGSLNIDELFYLRSRGISFEEAKLLQQQAFASAVLEKLSNNQLKERLMGMVEKRLRGSFARCSGCTKHCCE